MSIFDNFPGWRQAKEITIPGTYVPSGGLTNVPVVVRFSNDADIGAICRSDGYDIRFCDDSGAELSQYRLSFSVASGQASGEFWVLLPSISQDGKTIYMLFGNPSASDVSNASVDPDILTDGDFEQWNSPTDLTNWVEYVAGSSTINRESTEKTRGNYSVRFDVDASNTICYVYQNILPKYIAGKKYIINFNFKSSVGNKNLYLQIAGYTGSTYYWYDFINNIWSSNTQVLYQAAGLSWSLFTKKILQDPPEFIFLNMTIGRGTVAASSSLYFDDAHMFAGDTEAHCDFISASWYNQFSLTFGSVFSVGTVSFEHTQTTNISGKKGGRIDILSTIILSLSTKRVKRVYLKKESSIATVIVGKSRIKNDF